MQTEHGAVIPERFVAKEPRMRGRSTSAIETSKMFTYAIERAMDANKLKVAGVGDPLARNRARHESIAQYLLDYILKSEGELDLFLKAFGLSAKHEAMMYTELSEGEFESRFDHCIDDRKSFELWEPLCIIEDKVDSKLEKTQLKRYFEYLSGGRRPRLLLVLHPARNPLNGTDGTFRDLDTREKHLRVQKLSWSSFASKMIEVDPKRDSAALYGALVEFTESVGTGDLSNLPPASVLTRPGTAGELRDLLLSAQGVAAQLSPNSRRSSLKFSMHKGNSGPWLQVGMTNGKRASLGLQIDLTSEPGRLKIGTRGPKDPDWREIDSKIGIFRDGILTPAAQSRVEDIRLLAEAVRSGETSLPEKLPGRESGKHPSEMCQDAMTLIASIFQASALRNPYRGGGDSRDTRGVNQGSRGERLGVRLVSESGGSKREVGLFLGPPDDSPWIRSTVWIRTHYGEREIEVVEDETGADYVLKVWSTAREALRRELP